MANDLSLVIGFTRIDQKVILMQLEHQFNSYNAIANDLSLAIGFTRIDWKVVLMQLGHQFNSYKLMHIQES
jgi:hypothetical protein